MLEMNRCLDTGGNFKQNNTYYDGGFGPQTQWRSLRKAFTSELGLDALSLAYPAVVQLVVFFNSGLQ